MFGKNIRINNGEALRKAKLLVPIIILVAAGITGILIESERTASLPEDIQSGMITTATTVVSSQPTFPPQTTTVTSTAEYDFFSPATKTVTYSSTTLATTTMMTVTSATRTTTIAGTTMTSTRLSNFANDIAPNQVKVVDAGSKILPDRLVIYSANIELNVSNVQSTLPLIEQIAVSEGGYVGRTSLQPIPKGTYIDGKKVDLQGFTATITILVPANHYGEAQSQVMRLGKVNYYWLSSQDVTDAAVDLEGRLKNAEIVLRQYNDILGRAVRIEDILSIQTRVDNIQERIEVLKAQIQNLQKQAGYATIAITLIEPLKFKKEEAKLIDEAKLKEQPNPYTAALNDSLTLAGSALMVEATSIIFLTVGLFPIWLLLGVGYIAYRRVVTVRKEPKQQQ